MRRRGPTGQDERIEGGAAERDCTPAGLERLADAYSRCLTFAERAPWLVWVKGKRRPFRLPLLGGRALRYLMARRVKRGVILARRALMRMSAAGQDVKPQLDRLDALEQALPPLVFTRQALFAAVIGLLLLQAVSAWAGPSSDLLTTVLREVLTLDPEAAWEAVKDNTGETRAAAVVLFALFLPVLLLVPQWTFRLARRVLSSPPQSLPATAPRKWDPRPGGGNVYDIEREVFQALCARRPHQHQLDLTFWASLAGPLALAFWLAGVDLAAEGDDMEVAIAFLVVAAGLFATMLATLHRWRRRERARWERWSWALHPVSALCALAVFTTGFVYVLDDETGLYSEGLPEPGLTRVEISERAVTLGEVKQRYASRGEAVLSDPASGSIASGGPADSTRGVLLTYTPEGGLTQCPDCVIRWRLYDTDTLGSYSEGEGWPHPGLRYDDDRARPDRIWVPLPSRPGTFAVKVAIVPPYALGIEGATAVAERPVIVLNRPANPP